MKQTAVEWFIEQLEEKGDLRETPSIRIVQLNIDTSDYLDIKRQAKAMHKEEILIAYDNGWEAGSYNPEQYYNETYGKNTTDNTNL
jgi:hypothetical protein